MQSTCKQTLWNHWPVYAKLEPKKGHKSETDYLHKHWRAVVEFNVLSFRYSARFMNWSPGLLKIMISITTNQPSEVTIIFTVVIIRKKRLLEMSISKTDCHSPQNWRFHPLISNDNNKTPNSLFTFHDNISSSAVTLGVRKGYVGFRFQSFFSNTLCKTHIGSRINVRSSRYEAHRTFGGHKSSLTVRREKL